MALGDYAGSEQGHPDGMYADGGYVFEFGSDKAAVYNLLGSEEGVSAIREEPQLPRREP